MPVTVRAAGTVRIGGGVEVARLGCGAVRLTGQPGNCASAVVVPAVLFQYACFVRYP
jgi:hypothetical protein